MHHILIWTALTDPAVVIPLVYIQAPSLFPKHEPVEIWPLSYNTDSPQHKQGLSGVHLWSGGVVGGEPLPGSQRCKISKLLSPSWAERSSGNSMMSEARRTFIHIPDWFWHIKEWEVQPALIKGDGHMCSSNNTPPPPPPRTCDRRLGVSPR